MKMQFVLRSLLAMTVVAPGLVLQSVADPILPYQQPIKAQLDANAGTPTIDRALRAYGKASRSLSGDISILRNLNTILANEPNYPALLSSAAAAYIPDFADRRAALAEQLRPAPRSQSKTTAQRLLRRIDTALSNAENAVTTSQRITQLASAASNLATASNTIQSALRAPLGLSAIVANIGELPFQSNRGFTLGGTNFAAEPGVSAGGFDPGSGTLWMFGTDNGNYVRSLGFSVRGITTNAPVTYALGAGDNLASYRATDRQRSREYVFEGQSSLTTSRVPEAFLTIDYFGSNYVLGRFAFVGTNASHTLTDTNTVVTVHGGEFQLNFSH